MPWDKQTTKITAIQATSKRYRRVRNFFTDLKVAARRFRCVFTAHGGGRHLREIGMFAKPGFRGSPLRQCERCGTIGLSDVEAKRQGGRPL